MAKQRGYFASHYQTTTKGKPLNFDKFYYLAAIYADVSTDITLMTSAQVGKTEWITCDAFSLISLGVSYQIVQPKEELRVLFNRTRINQPIARSPYYKKHIRSVGSIYQWFDDNNIPNGNLRITFSNKEDEMIAFPADAVGIDELDRCNMSNIALLPDRMLNSEYRLWRRSSTPTTVGTDANQNIHYEFKNTDQREYYVVCPECKQWTDLDWYKHVVEEKRDPTTGHITGVELRDRHWRSDFRRDINLICDKCGGILDRTAKGEWRPTVAIPQRVWKRGYHISKLPNIIIPVSQMWSDYSAAINNPSQMQRFSNSVLGLAYVGAGSKLTEYMLTNATRRMEYHMDTLHAKHPGPCSMGVDVGPGTLDVRISSYPIHGERIAKAEYIGKVKGFDDLHKLVSRFGVVSCVIDAEPEVRESLKFQKEAKCDVYVCYTRDKESMELKDLLLDQVKLDKKFTIDRTLFMDAVLAAFANGQQILPRNYRFLSGEAYANEMLNPTRVLVVEDNSGGRNKAQGRVTKERFRWTSGADHSYMATVYDFCAGLIGSFSASPSIAMKGRVKHLEVGNPILEGNKIFDSFG